VEVDRFAEMEIEASFLASPDIFLFIKSSKGNAFEAGSPGFCSRSRTEKDIVEIKIACPQRPGGVIRHTLSCARSYPRRKFFP
jgi:hypothetical protein